MKAYIKNPKIVVPFCENTAVQINFQGIFDTGELSQRVNKSLVAIADEIIADKDYHRA